jgi:flagellar motor component MotA
MNFEWTITLGKALPYIMTFFGIVGAAVLGWFVNKVKKALLEEWAALVAVFKTDTQKTITDSEEKLLAQLADTNRRVSDLASGASALKTEVHEFREHVGRHFVEKDEIQELRSSIDKSIERMQNSLELATATMSDVRDSVISLTATKGTTKVPPTRRRTTTRQSHEVSILAAVHRLA